MIVLINKYQLYNNNNSNNNKDKEITNGTSLGQKKSSLLSYALFISPASPSICWPSTPPTRLLW